MAVSELLGYTSWDNIYIKEYMWDNDAEGSCSSSTEIWKYILKALFSMLKTRLYFKHNVEIEFRAILCWFLKEVEKQANPQHLMYALNYTCPPPLCYALNLTRVALDVVLV